MWHLQSWSSGFSPLRFPVWDVTLMNQHFVLARCAAHCSNYWVAVTQTLSTMELPSDWPCFICASYWHLLNFLEFLLFLHWPWQWAHHRVTASSEGAFYGSFWSFRRGLPWSIGAGAYHDLLGPWLSYFSCLVWHIFHEYILHSTIVPTKTVG